MKTLLKYILILLTLTSVAQARVGACEVLPDAQKEKYLECLVKEAEKTDDVADINMVAYGYGVYGMDEGIDWYKKSIKKGDAKAMYEVANSYAYYLVVYSEYDKKMLDIVGEVSEDYKNKFNKPKKAIPLYKQAALQNYKDSIAKLSELMEKLYGKEGAIKQYKKEMAQGDKNTYRFLANLYVRFGAYDKALKLYEKALQRDDTNRGDIYALIGSLYEAQYKDKKEAKHYYEQAAKEGNAIAMYNLGIMAGDGKDYKKAEEWFRASEKAGEKYALGTICHMYKTKLDDYDRAEKCYLELAKTGDAKYMSALGYFYRHNMRDYKKGIIWNIKAYKAGSSQAAIGLGAHYSSPYEGAYNKEKAIYWYKKAAAMGESGAWQYLYGEGVL